MKHFSICLLLLSTILIINAQNSIHLVTTNPSETSTISVINNGGGYSITTTANTSDVPTKFRFYNIDANNTYTYNVLRTIKALNTQGTATASTYFCVGSTCLPPTANTLTNPADYIVLSPGSSDKLITYFNEISPIGYSEVYYKIFNVNNPNDSLSFTIFYNSALSVKNLNSDLENLIISPVPAKDHLSIQSHINAPMEFKFVLFNILGQTILNYSEKVKEGFYNKQLDISSLPEGLYFLTIQSDKMSNLKVSKKIIISR